VDDACTVLWIDDGVAFFEFQVKTSLKSDPERIGDETPKPTNTWCLFHSNLLVVLVPLASPFTLNG
jgi:hypothetical protein